MIAPVIADEFILMALAPSNEGWLVGADGVPIAPPHVAPGVSAALLAELALAGAIDATGRTLSVIGPRAGADDGLAETLAWIARQSRPRSPDWWVDRLAATGPERGRLVELHRRGWVHAYPGSRRGLTGTRPATYWFIREDDTRTPALVDRLRAGLQAGRADDRTTALLAVMQACQVHRAYFKDWDEREREQRVQALTAGHWVGAALRRHLGAATTTAGLGGL